MKKRFLAWVLAIVMIAALLPTAALAEDVTILPDYSWYTEAAAEYTIQNAAQLLGFANIANGTSGLTGLSAATNFEGKKITLLNDIDLGGMTWTPIKSFKGELDGNGKSISNFEMGSYWNDKGTETRSGFFGGIESGDGVRVHDLTIQNVKATVGNGRFGTLANYISGIVNRVTIRNVHVTTTHTDAWVGGMCAFMSWPWMNDCIVENLTVDAAAGAQFIAGFAPILQKNDNMVFDNCDVKGVKIVVADNSNDCLVGGFVGQTQRGWEFPKMINCDVTGIDITASGAVIVGGFIACPGAHTTAENCTAQGKIDATGLTDGCAGGFFGDLGWNCNLGKVGHKITGCTADVDIRTKDVPAGGFVGSATNSNERSMYATFTGCEAKGDITGIAGGTAPVGGFAGDADRGDYMNCTASGNVSGSVAGGFIGKILDTNPAYDGRANGNGGDNVFSAKGMGFPADTINITGCRASGCARGTEKVGGLIGNVEDKVDNTFVNNKNNSKATNPFGNGKLTIENSTAAPTIIGMREDTLTAPVLNRNENSKDIGKLEGNTGTASVITPVAGTGSFEEDTDGIIQIPDGKSILINGQETEYPYGGKILRNGEIVSGKDEQAELISTILPAITGSNPFSDVPGSAYYNAAVRWAVKNGIASGTDAKRFSPDAPCTRAQAVTFLWRAAGSPAPTLAENPFADVKPTDYCYDAVLWAVETGIAKGTSTAAFSPDASCTRGQIVTFLYRAAGSPAGYANSGYADVPETSYCAAPVAWASALRITSGTTALTFSPDALCTRAQIVTFLYRANA